MFVGEREGLGTRLQYIIVERFKDKKFHGRLPYIAGKFRIIRKCAVCAKIKTFEMFILSACGCGLNRVIVYCCAHACDFENLNFEIFF